MVLVTKGHLALWLEMWGSRCWCVNWDVLLAEGDFDSLGDFGSLLVGNLDMLLDPVGLMDDVRSLN